MSDKEILERAIQKAIDGGWKVPVNKNSAGIKQLIKDNSVFDIIFNHEFAKHLFGLTNPYEISRSENGLRIHTFGGPAYLYHLQQMVISENPIKYLSENI